MMAENPQFGTDVNKFQRKVTVLPPSTASTFCPLWSYNKYIEIHVPSVKAQAGVSGKRLETAIIINRDKPTIIQTTRHYVLPFPDLVVLEYTRRYNIAFYYVTEFWSLSVAQLHHPSIEAELVSPTPALHSILPSRAGAEMCRINFGKSARGHAYGAVFRKSYEVSVLLFLRSYHLRCLYLAFLHVF